MGTGILHSLLDVNCEGLVLHHGLQQPPLHVHLIASPRGETLSHLLPGLLLDNNLLRVPGQLDIAAGEDSGGPDLVSGQLVFLADNADNPGGSGICSGDLQVEGLE